MKTVTGIDTLIRAAEAMTGCLARVMSLENPEATDWGNACRPESLCAQVQTNELGRRTCAESHLEGAEKARRSGEPYLFECHAGLTECAIPTGDGRVVLLVGQALTREATELLFREAQTRLGDLELSGAEIVSRLARMTPVSPKRLRESAEILAGLAGPTETAAAEIEPEHKTGPVPLGGRSRKRGRPSLLTFTQGDARRTAIWLLVGNLNQARGFFVETLREIDRYGTNQAIKHSLYRRFQGELMAALSELDLPYSGFPDPGRITKGKQSLARALGSKVRPFLKKVAERGSGRIRGEVRTRLATVLDLLESRTPGKVTLVEAARAAGIREGSLSRLFRKTFAISFSEYRNLLRIGWIRKSLRDDPSVRSRDLAQALELSDQSYVFKILKRYDGRRVRELATV